ncbi:hypothetical protein IW261DRAFT_96111 [Armillaria novae-zelandiae]|uniref:Uncharacterized protein n=1 Tax=Armillaria novae-zelandiae TaxID=153914 RepID=A0AA39PYP1_9AGAR|nr:hypothetical protein IW261DRAFT_96111 [Armillaria novae-zelandiae]
MAAHGPQIRIVAFRSFRQGSHRNYHDKRMIGMFSYFLGTISHIGPKEGNPLLFVCVTRPLFPSMLATSMACNLLISFFNWILFGVDIVIAITATGGYCSLFRISSSWYFRKHRPLQLDLRQFYVPVEYAVQFDVTRRASSSVIISWYTRLALVSGYDTRPEGQNSHAVVPSITT